MAGVADGGPVSADLRGLGDERQAVEVIVVALALGHAERHLLVGAEVVDGGLTLGEQLALGRVRLGIS